MDLFEALKGRRSVRRFLNKDVPDELIAEVVRYATMAPSAHNRQPWEFAVTRDAEKKKALARRTYVRHLERAPVAIAASVLVSEDPRLGVRSTGFALQDVCAAIQNLLLAAHGLGLGTCWIGDFDEHQVREIFGIPGDRLPVGVIALGWPDGMPAAPRRKALQEVLYWESYDRNG